MKLFIDTNILLHFSPLEQVDWLEVCGDRDVEIAIAPVIIEELDKQKRNPRLSKRARAAIRKIQEIGINGQWAPNVKINVLTTRPQDNIFLKYSLDKGEQDDRLLASILEYALDSDEKVKLVTNDLGPRLKCVSLGIEALALPDKYELNEEEDDLLRENSKLRDQIYKYQLAIPKLKLVFDDGKAFFSIKLERLNFSEYRKGEMLKIESEHPYMEVPNDKTFHWAVRHPFINEESVNNYNSELFKFYLAYEAYLLECEVFFTKVSLTETIKFKLINDGSIPANDIDVQLHFPDGFKLKDSKPKNKAQKPRPPFKPGDALRLNPSIFSSLVTPSLNPVPLPGRGSPSIKKTNSYDVAFNLDTLKHNQSFIFEDLYLTFDSLGAAKGFAVDYKIFAANIPDVLSGQVNILVEKSPPMS